MRWIFAISLLVCFASSQSNKFLHVSDIHYDPLGDPLKYGTSTFCRDPSNQVSLESIIRDCTDEFFFEKAPNVPEIFSNLEKVTKGMSYPYGRYGCDTPGTLLNSSMTTMQKTLPNPDFVLITGDLAAHNLNQESVHTKSMTVVTHALEQVYPNTPLYFTIGNNDVFMDYNATCRSPEYTILGNLWKKWIPADQLSDFQYMGSYWVNPKPGFRIVLLNTVMYSVRFNATNPSDPCNQFQWLKEVLGNASAQGEKVWIAGHIPPGIDAYRGTALWQPKYATMLFNMMEKFNNVQGMFFGHLHRDSFRVYRTTSGNNFLSYGLLAPSISPVTNSNPSFRVYSWDPTHFLVTDYNQYFLNLYKANLGHVNWVLEYNFLKAYGSNLTFNPVNFESLWNRISTDSRILEDYYFRRVVQFKVDIFSDICSINYQDSSSFAVCMESLIMSQNP